MTKEELEKIEEAARWQENYDKQLKDIKKLHKACHKWFMRWREAKKDALYFDSSLQKQIEATLNLQKELNALQESIKDYGAGCYENGLRNGKRKLEAQIEKMRCCGNCRFGYCERSSERIDKDGNRTFHCWNQEKEKYCDVGKNGKYQCWEIKEK